MSFNMRDYVSDDHIESVGEIAKSQSAIIQALSLENSKLQTQLQQKENIIKEAIKYLPILRRSVSYELDDKVDELEMILDKEDIWN